MDLDLQRHVQANFACTLDAQSAHSTLLLQISSADIYILTST